MSIIRKRQRKLIGIGVIGFSAGAILMMLLALWIIRYQEDWIVGLQEGRDVEQKEEIIEKESVYTVIEAVAKGERVTKEKLMRMEVEPRFVPTNYIKDIASIEGKRTKMALEPRMLLTRSMVESEATPYLEEGMERIEISALHTPKLMEVGDRVNIRIQFPTGQDYRLIANKELIDVDTEMEIFYIDLNEEEILNFSSGLVDETIYPGTRLYMTKYLPPDGEDQAESIYPMNPNVEEMGIVKANSHAVEERMILDASLMEYYDDDTIIYRYNQLELGEQELTERAKTYKVQREERGGLSEAEEKDEDGNVSSAEIKTTQESMMQENMTQVRSDENGATGEGQAIESKEEEPSDTGNNGEEKGANIEF